MKDLILIEKTNILNSKRLVIMSISLVLISFTCFLVYYVVEGFNIMGSLNLLLILNSQIIFPIIFSSFIMLSYLSDFKNGNSYLIKLSPVSKVNIFISKFFINIFFILLCLFSIVNLYVISNFLFTNKSYVFIEFLKFNFLEVLIRVNIVLVCMFSYIVCFCLLGILFILILPKFPLGIILITVITIIQTSLPLPNHISKYLFVSNYNVHSALHLVEFPINRIMEAFFINVINGVLLLLFSIVIYQRRFQLKEQNKYE